MSEITQQVRRAVRAYRYQAIEDFIQRKIAWSRKDSQRKGLNRLFPMALKREYTREEAIAMLDAEPQFGCWTVREEIERYNYRVLAVCQAIETAEAHGLPLKLTVQEVNLLKEWSE